MPFSVSARRAIRCSLIAAATVLFAGLPAWGQAAPSLIPYTISTFAGGGATATYAAGGTCPVSKRTETDQLGDGCLATEITLKAPWFITQDKNGNYFFSDSANYAIRRIDGTTGVITLVAGNGYKSGVSAGTGTCPSGGTITSVVGDGCLGTDAYLGRTDGIAISPLTGNLYFTDAGDQSVHMITAASNCNTTVTPNYCYIVPSTTTGNSTGVMSLITGNPVSGKIGYDAGDPTTATQVSAASGLLVNPYGLWFDPVGDLYIADVYHEAILVVNTNSIATAPTGISIPPGDITKISGALSSTTPTCINGAGSSGVGCNYTGLATGTAANGKAAITLPIDAPIQMVTDTTGNVYVSETYDNDVYQVSTTGLFNVYTGARGSKGAPARGPATSEKIGSEYGLGIDTANNLYIVDGSYGEILRVDNANQGMYIIGGGGTSTFTAGVACPIGFGTATDTAGDGCPATTVAFANAAGGYGPSSTSTLNAASILTGMYMDSAGNALVADDGLNVIHKLASGTAFGNVVGSRTQYLDIHFGVGDTPLASSSLAYVVTTTSGTTPAGALITPVPTVFTTTGSASCTTNSDSTDDCVLPVVAGASVSGTYTGSLTVTSKTGKISTFPLTVTIVVPVASSTTTTVYGSCGPGGVSTITAHVTNPVGTPAGGTVTFYVNNVALPTTYVLPVTGSVQTTYTFAAGATYTVTASYGGDPVIPPATIGNDLASTSATQQPTSFTSGTLVVAAGSNSGPPASSGQTASVSAGGTAEYSLNVLDYSVTTSTPVTLVSVSCTISYNGTVLSAGADGVACIPYPTPSTATNPPTVITLQPATNAALPAPQNCYNGTTVALSVTTTQGSPVYYGFGASSKNKWALLGTLPALLLGMLVMFRRRRSQLKFSGVLMALAFLLALAGTLGCGNDYGSYAPGTPTGTYTFTVTVVDSVGDTYTTPTATPFTLTVH